MFYAYLDAPDRFAFWQRWLADLAPRTFAEIGVYRGDFAAAVLGSVPTIEQYVMVDPWRAIADWNKPANTDDLTFEGFYQDSLRVTDFAAGRRQVLRGKTTEVAGQIPDGSLDAVYIDGDHTLKGIAIDLMAMYPKVRDGGWITGDDFCDSIWQHPENFEPTLIFPFAVYFAEAHGLTIHALPHNQFAMRKQATGFRFIDTTGSYGDLSIRRHVRPA